jgi:hypothetical protein
MFGTVIYAAAAYADAVVHAEVIKRLRRKAGSVRMNLTEHFTDAELGVAGCDEQLVENARFLCAEILEPIRTKFGPVRVHDGYRDQAHNARVGGKADSFHLFEWGRAAADIDAVYASVTDVFNWLRLESKLRFDKVILESNAAGVPATVHIQVDRLKDARRLAYTGHTGNGTTYLPQTVA